MAALADMRRDVPGAMRAGCPVSLVGVFHVCIADQVSVLMREYSPWISGLQDGYLAP